MKSTIISIGDELIAGNTVNSSSKAIAAELEKSSYRVNEILTIGDNKDQIVDTIKRALKKKIDLLLITGGLGPTEDDITRESISKATNLKLSESSKALKLLQKKFKIKSLSKDILKQTMIPTGALALRNSVGVAPGIYIELKDSRIIALPGPPREAIAIFKEEVRPILKKQFKGEKITDRLFRTCMIGELELAKILDEAMIRPSSYLKIGFLPHLAMVDIRITLLDNDKVVEFGKITKKIKLLLKDFIYSQQEISIADTIRDLFISKRLALGSVESCTGGRFASKIIASSGASKYFLEGLVTYSNSSKISRVKVDKNLIKKHGAVSKEVAIAMANGCRKTAKVDVAIASTGIAEASADLSDKPVGLLFIAIATKDETVVSRFQFSNSDRDTLQEKSANVMLSLLYKKVAIL
ncbi:MAG: nicotinamide-nucleotide amidohydrolase family protein [Nitrospinota bacterium]